MATITNIVLVHDAWADASSWSRIIPLLQQEGYRLAGVQLPLTSLAEDITATRRVLNWLEGPTILVGHGYGGAVITAAAVGMPSVIGLFYIAAFVPAPGDTMIDLNNRFSPPPEGIYIQADQSDFLWLDAHAFPKLFAGDIEPALANIMAVVQKPIARAIFAAKAGEVAWQNLPSWYLICDNDLVITPQAERWMADRIGATTRSISSSHVPMLSHPREVTDLILEAAGRKSL